MRLFFIAAAFFVSQAATAATIYSIDRQVGIGNVTGTFTTDSSVGVLDTGNFTDWTLALDNGVENFVLTSDNSELVVHNSSGVTATVDSLSFDFSGEGGGIFVQFEALGSGKTTWCLGVTGCSYTGPGDLRSGEKLYIGYPGSGPGAVISDPYSGVQVFATTVPVPAAVWLFGSALAGLGWLRRKQTV